MMLVPLFILQKQKKKALQFEIKALKKDSNVNQGML
jgi:hypothetical protein